MLSSISRLNWPLVIIDQKRGNTLCCLVARTQFLFHHSGQNQSWFFHNLFQLLKTEKTKFLIGPKNPWPFRNLFSQCWAIEKKIITNMNSILKLKNMRKYCLLFGKQVNKSFEISPLTVWTEFSQQKKFFLFLFRCCCDPRGWWKSVWRMQVIKLQQQLPLSCLGLLKIIKPLIKQTN